MKGCTPEDNTPLNRISNYFDYQKMWLLEQAGVDIHDYVSTTGEEVPDHIARAESQVGFCRLAVFQALINAGSGLGHGEIAELKRIIIGDGNFYTYSVILQEHSNRKAGSQELLPREILNFYLDSQEVTDHFYRVLDSVYCSIVQTEGLAHSPESDVAA